MQTLTLALAGHQYPIHTGSGLLRDAEFMRLSVPHQQVLVLTDTNVSANWLAPLQSAFVGRDYHELVLPPGEQQKSLSGLSMVLDALVAAKMRRNSVLIALGGGVIGDLGGFAASCYQRGIDIVQVPTTLLAQVDSSVGGKTAINHLAGKNLIGAFHQPKCVIADIQTLETLPRREFVSGFAEIIKYGVIQDASFLSWLESHADELISANADALSHAVLRSCAIKAEIVEQDPKETGVRAFLNYGHTFAHAIEAEMGYGTWLHGEAVAVGMVMAAHLALLSGVLSDSSLPVRLITLLAKLQLPTELPAKINRMKLLDHMQLDKKNISTAIRFVLPASVGKIQLVEGIAAELVMQAMGDRRGAHLAH